jgi:hypothetical protein
MRTRRQVWTLTVLLIVVGGTAWAQEPPPPSTVAARLVNLVEIRLVDGSVLYGTIESEAAASVVLRTIGGLVVTLERAQIASIEQARGEIVNGEFRQYDSNATRLLFAPTGRNLAKGEGYLGVYEFLLPFVQYGITDRFSFGAGTPLIFVGDADGRPIWLTPKYQVYNAGRTSAAIGVMHFVILGEDVRMGLAYGVVTRGTPDTAVTIGAGWAYSRYRDTEYTGNCFGPPSASMVPCVREEVTHTPGSAVAMIGGEQRVNRRVKLISENYVFKQGVIVSAGVRFLGERLSADLGVFAPIVEDGFFVGPVVNFVWTFGR